jgi:hypothetical protein
LIEHAHPTQHLFSFFSIQLPEVLSFEQNLTESRFDQPQHMSHKGTFAASASTHDDKDLSTFDKKIEVALDDE